jgi:hypothetical protein
LDLEVLEPNLFSPEDANVDALRIQMDEVFPVLSYLCITWSSRNYWDERPFHGGELVLPSSLTHLRTTISIEKEDAPLWPKDMTHLDLRFVRIKPNWVAGLPAKLTTLKCQSFPSSLIPQLATQLPLLKTFSLDEVDSPHAAIETISPATLTSLGVRSDWTPYSPCLSLLPPKLVTLDFWGNLMTDFKAADILALPRTVTRISFPVRGLDCLEVVPEGLRELDYRQRSNKIEEGIGQLLPKGLTRLSLAKTRLPDPEYRFLPSTLLDLEINTLDNANVKNLAHLKFLETLRVFGGKLSRHGFLRIPRSVRHLELHRTFLSGTDALQNTLPNLTAFTYKADEHYALVLKPEVFSALPISLQSLTLWLGSNHARFPMTSDLVRLKNLRSFDSLGAPYDATTECISRMPPYLTHLTCNVSWALSESDLLRLPQSIRYVFFKTLSHESGATTWEGLRKEIEKRSTFVTHQVALPKTHPSQFYQADLQNNHSPAAEPLSVSEPPMAFLHPVAL